MKYRNFQDFLFGLTTFWTDLGCFWSQPYDSAMGAGTFHPNTFLRGLGTEPWRVVYVQPCRRPVDGRYGKSTYRFQHYYQLQVFLKPAPADIIETRRH
jgi:glycyl-tRNA synthetase alpha subunit